MPSGQDVFSLSTSTPFCEESFVSVDFTGTHASLPNLGVLKATCDCVRERCQLGEVCTHIL